MTQVRTVLSILLLSPLGSFAADAPTAALTFEDHVRPILKAHCFECHGENGKPKGDLDVRLARLLLKGGENGPAVTAGAPDASLLIDKLTAGEMPPGKKKKKLEPAQVELIRRWIAGGAKTARPEPETVPAGGMLITAAEENFWSFQPIRSPAAPQVKHAELVRTPIDAFLLARLEEKELSFSPEADRPTLIRRAYFDLIGLPPTPKEVDAFVNDPSPQAFEKVLDHLLGSPHYGERWGRHWLDVAGYADSEGSTGDDPIRKSAWKYRDYVIRSLNADKPWDQFIHEQLAGDEMVKGPLTRLSTADADKLDKLIATGFLRMAPDGTATASADLPVEANQTVADTIQIVSTALLGMTVQCAQCHNHRYDPIPQLDYYKMRAVFEPALSPKDWRRPAAREISVIDPDATKKAAELEAAAKQIEQERLEKYNSALKKALDVELAKVPDDVREPLEKAFHKTTLKRSVEENKLLAKYPALTTMARKIEAQFAGELAKAAALRAQKPAAESIRACTEVPGKVSSTFLFDRGDINSPKDPVAPGTLTVLARHDPGTIAEDDPALLTTGRRLAFAQWLTRDTNPLTARVLVNRFWMHHFGRGIVNTPGDFGGLGERPTHPELLDWLASDFRGNGWKLKRFHKLLMTSTAYRQSSIRAEALQAADPENKLLGRMPVRRLEAEIVRDALLAVSGKLNPKTFGPPVPIKADEQGQIVVGVDTTDGAGRPTGKVVPLNGEEFRRSVYVTVRRSKPLGMLEAFDPALVTPTCEVRTPSTVAPQSLLLMNNPVVVEQSEFFADRLMEEAGRDTKARANLAWKYTLAKEPTTEELAWATEYLAEQTAAYKERKIKAAGGDPAKAALADLCHVLMSSNPFLYVE